MSAENPAPQRPPSLTLRWWIRHLYRAWHDDRVSGLAAEIGFFALLSLFPLLLVSSSALGSLGDVLGSDLSDDVENQLAEWAGNLFGTDGGVTLAIRALFEGSSTSALTVGVVATIYTASRGFSAVVRALDVAYGHHNTRGWVGTQIIGFLLAIGTIVVGSLTLAGLVIGPLFGREDFLGDGVLGNTLSWLWRWLRYPAAAATLVTWSATIYHIAPNRRASWRREFPGAVFSALFSLLATVLFSVYLATLSSTTNAVFGVIGAAITLQLWLYLLAIGLVLGAEVNAGFALQRGPAENWTEPLLFTRAFRWARWWVKRRR
ncbi:MAG: membrane protein [Verrucomicrobiales bacterium]|jgi:membrane protein